MSKEQDNSQSAEKRHHAMMQYSPLQVVSKFAPAGDQPKAINELSKGIEQKKQFQILKGVTGSGKTFTMAKTIEKLQRPTLVISHNKTLAAQLYREFKEFFPNNAVGYFVSYYDYYQPEAYVPGKDLFIEKDSAINDEIDRLRLAATTNLYSRNDVIIVATVSCIFGLGNPSDYRDMTVIVQIEEELDIMKLRQKLIALQYNRNDAVLERGNFRIQDEVIDIYPAYEECIYRIILDWERVQKIYKLDPVTQEIIKEQSKLWVFPAKHFITTDDKIKSVLQKIKKELELQYKFLIDKGDIVSAERLKSRTEYDIEMLISLGSCAGIENYSRYLSGREAGERPSVLLDYFPSNYLLFIDESHVTIPQIGAMYEGDRSRKENLVKYGFRLPSAKDNRPLTFKEFESVIPQCVFVSATPGKYELQATNDVVEQVVRPTGLLDPKITVFPTKGQIDDLIFRIKDCIKKNERVLVTTLTKKMAEQLSDYLNDMGLKVEYLHSEVEIVERVEILTRLRQGKIEVVVGINLLREGIDLPEVSLVAIFDADKIGFLRSTRSLIQTIGRAARHINGQVVMYADKTSDAMKEAIEETERRRELQHEFNEKHGLKPKSIQKAVQDILVRSTHIKKEATEETVRVLKESHNLLVAKERKKLIKKLEKQMYEHSECLEFEEARVIRDEIQEIKKL